MLQPDDKPSCATSGLNPDYWYPEPDGSGRIENTPTHRLMIEQSVQALMVCNDCPLMTNGKCLEYAMADTTTIDFGIFAGTLAYERRAAVGATITSGGSGLVYQQKIRKAALQAGLITPLIPRRERPKPSRLEFVPAFIGKEKQ